MPKVSILMPVLNAGKYLAGTLDTIVSQTFKDWELILMDGASTDDTLAVARRYAALHPNIRVFSEPDEGPHDAMLKALRKARGEYMLVSCAGDGYLADRWFEMCMDVFNKDPEVSLVWGIPFGVSEEGKLIGPHFAYGNFLEDAPANTPFLKELFRRMLHPSSLLRLVKRLNPQAMRVAKGVLKKRGIPQKQEWFWYWLDTGVQFPDGNMCINRHLFEKFIAPHTPGAWESGTWTDFYFNLNAQGYLAYGFPIPASFARMTPGRISERVVIAADRNQKAFFKKLAALRKEMRAHPEKMVFRARTGEPIAAHAVE